MVNLVTDANRCQPFLKKLDKLPDISGGYERNRIFPSKSPRRTDNRSELAMASPSRTDVQVDGQKPKSFRHKKQSLKPVVFARSSTVPPTLDAPAIKAALQRENVNRLNDGKKTVRYPNKEINYTFNDQHQSFKEYEKDKVLPRHEALAKKLVAMQFQPDTFN